MKFHHISLQHGGTYATSSSTIRGVPNVPKRSKSAMQRLPPNMEVSSRNSPAPAGRKMVLVAHHGAGGEIAVNVLDPQRWRCHGAFWRQSSKPWWEHARSTARHDTQTEKVGQGCSPSRGKLGRGATSAPCPLEIRQSCHTVLINWVSQEQYRFSLSLVSKIQGCNV